ncbi:MAG TPA: hypothetical protein VJG90_07220 [Candidatus Nanoarchaeia archaeon]|nr:hypothetical protein [Candidatus Nanoarchaeia archaeon]
MEPKVPRRLWEADLIKMIPTLDSIRCGISRYPVIRSGDLPSELCRTDPSILPAGNWLLEVFDSLVRPDSVQAIQRNTDFVFNQYLIGRNPADTREVVLNATSVYTELLVLFAPLFMTSIQLGCALTPPGHSPTLDHLLWKKPRRFATFLGRAKPQPPNPSYDFIVSLTESTLDNTFSLNLDNPSCEQEAQEIYESLQQKRASYLERLAAGRTA